MPAPSSPPAAASQRTVAPRPAAARWRARALDPVTGGLLLLVAAAVALVWANSPWAAAYESVVTARIGPAAWNLDLSVSAWAADGLLAVFFYVAGLELRREFAFGALSIRATAAVPIVAAVGGMVVPAAAFLLVAGSTGASADGWAVPVATDIAFALAVLAVVGSRLPATVRAFLLTLAVVDDLGAILVIAVVFSPSVSAGWLLAAAAGLAAFWWAQRRRWRSAWLYVPLAAGIWFAVHEAGVHATVAGLALALVTRVRRDPGESEAPADRLLPRLIPVSALVCAPLFAFTAAGVSLVGGGLAAAFADPVLWGVVLGLVVGKPLGILGAAWLATRFTGARLGPGLGMREVLVVGIVAGIGFTVSLLIAELSYASAPDQLAAAKVGVLASSVVAGLGTLLAARFALRRGATAESPTRAAAAVHG